ncbi:MAG: acyltransferase [Ilumatobacteraceae bacterium]
MPAVSPHSPQGQLSRVPYLPGLDGMRALAVGAVMVYHANHGWLPGGFIGVEIFFVISGYLITLLLLGEEERAGFINLTAFWTRRFRRLLPALLTMLTLLGMYMAFTRDKAMGRTCGTSWPAFRSTAATGTRSGWARGTPRRRPSSRFATCGPSPWRSSST